MDFSNQINAHSLFDDYQTPDAAATAAPAAAAAAPAAAAPAAAAGAAVTAGAATPNVTSTKVIKEGWLQLSSQQTLVRCFDFSHVIFSFRAERSSL